MAGARLSLPNSAAFAAASGTTAVVGYQQLYRTGDAGADLDAGRAAGIAEWAYLGFTDSDARGRARLRSGSIAPANEQLYYTTDGGQTYHLVPLPREAASTMDGAGRWTPVLGTRLPAPNNVVRPARHSRAATPAAIHAGTRSAHGSAASSCAASASSTSSRAGGPISCTRGRQAVVAVVERQRDRRLAGDVDDRRERREVARAAELAHRVRAQAVDLADRHRALASAGVSTTS